MQRQMDIREFGAVSGGIVDCTASIQAAIEEAGNCHGEVYIPSGTYLTGALFLESNMGMYLEEGAVLLGIPSEEAYPIVSGRVAGIEMDWPAAILNIRDAEHVRVYGNGAIDGQGEYWWKKYWGENRHEGMRKQYEEQGLRWAVDYDCFRTRNVIVINSRQIQLEGFRSKRSGFWNIHICYSENIEVKRIKISDNNGPSTDGIDIDSSRAVLVEACEISCNDDNICIKSGRDADGLRVNRVCEDIVIQNCRLFEGEGITIGSETSGGARNITVRDNMFSGTTNGFRLKSAKTRGGIVKDITVSNLKMDNVLRPFDFQFNWHPAYSYCRMPEGFDGRIPDYWKLLTQEVSEERGIPFAKNISIKNVTATITKELNNVEAFVIKGLKEAPFDNFAFENITIKAKSYGVIENIQNSKFINIAVTIL